MADDPSGGDRLPVPFDPALAAANEPDPDAPLSVTRRQFLRFMAAGGAGLPAAMMMSPGQLVRRARRVAAVMAAPAQVGPLPDLVVHAERDVDLVLLDFLFFGFAVRPGSPPAIVPTADDNFIHVAFPPQAIGEAVYSLVDPGTGRLYTDPAPILSALAEKSWLVFTLGANQTIPLHTRTVADLLDWSEWRPVVPDVARVDAVERRRRPGPPTLPLGFETRIECPYALYLSPTDGARFRGRQEPLMEKSRADCWGAVLTADPRVVATYARDYADGPPDLTPPEMRISYSGPTDPP